MTSVTIQVTILPSQLILQKGSRRTPAPTSEKAFTLAHISALFNDITERPSFKKNAWPCKKEETYKWQSDKSLYFSQSLLFLYYLHDGLFNKRVCNNTLKKFFHLLSSFITLRICEHQIKRKKLLSCLIVYTLIRSPVRQDNWTSEWLGSKEPVTISTPVKYIDGSFPGGKRNWK